MTRIVTTPAGKQVPLRAYVAAWRRMLVTPPETEVPGWEWYPVMAARILRDMRRGMNERITAGIPYALRGAQ